MNKTIRLAYVAGAVAAALACSKKDAASGAPGSPDAAGGAGNPTASATIGDDNDPCRLVTQAEAEKWVGPLAHAPFRSNDYGAPNPTGKDCAFVGTNGRYITMEVDWTDGKMGMKVMGIMGSLVNQVFTDNNGKTDTLEGTWDEARWMGPGKFFAVKEDVLVTANVGSTKEGVAAGADISSKALDRVGHLLPYNGAAAAATAPTPRETGDACALLTVAEIEAVVGPVQGAPVPSGRGESTDCTWRVTADGGVTDLKVDVSWRHGFENFAGNKQIMATVMGGIGVPQLAQGKTGESTKAESAKPGSPGGDPGMQKMLGVLKGLAKTQGIELDKNGQLAHDTLVTGPWDEGAILGGAALVAVKKDVQVSMEFRHLSIDQAKALMAKVMEKL